MQVNQSVFQAGVSEQDLDGAQVGSSVQQMGSATVPQTVWRQAFADAGLPGCLATSQPDDVGSDGYVSPPVVHGSGEEIGFRFHPTPIDAEGFEQCWTERHFAITATFALGNTNHHALTVNVTDLETAKFGSSHGGGIQGHEQGTVIQIACRIDEPGHFLRA